ncbi:MAG TPA: hypothetical protein PKB10_05155 [Tepidisphaeraceae bacterium]|nr:hypothetical protein [Tepidisphaeraceae bacterium]
MSVVISDASPVNVLVRIQQQDLNAVFTDLRTIGFHVHDAVLVTALNRVARHRQE